MAESIVEISAEAPDPEELVLLDPLLLVLPEPDELVEPTPLVKLTALPEPLDDPEPLAEPVLPEAAFRKA